MTLATEEELRAPKDVDVPPDDGGDDDDHDDGRRDDGRPVRWITVATFSLSVDAQMARLRLENEDIPCVILDENVVAINWLWASAVGGIKLQVPENLADDARNVLKTTSLTSMSVADGEPLFDGEVRCPRCGSDDLFMTRISRKMAMLSLLFLGAPLPFLRRNRKCAACGAEWR